jgi:hypothetical protein
VPTADVAGVHHSGKVEVRALQYYSYPLRQEALHTHSIPVHCIVYGRTV